LFGGHDNKLCCVWYLIGLRVRAPLDFPLNKLTVTRNDDEISASAHNIGIYMILFEQNCNNLKKAAIGRNM